MRGRTRALLALTITATVISGMPVVDAAPVAVDCVNDGYEPLNVPWNHQAWNGGAVSPLVDTQPHDAQGVRMYVRNGVQYDHPVAQAQYGLANLWSFTVTNDPRYLERARAQGQRLIDRGRVVTGALFFPYPFDFAVHGDARNTQRAPWYSGMAQGLALALFVRLFAQTLDTAWRDAAVNTYASFMRLRSDGSPWFDELDPSGFLWMQEYPGTTSDDTLNGHMFAALGLFDYYGLTSDAGAKQLFGCAISTVRHYATAFRNNSWISFYCLAHRAIDDKYHRIHVAELLRLHSYVGAPWLARLADDLSKDYPAPTAGQVRFSAGTFTGYRFASSGAITGRRTITLTRSSAAPADQRRRIHTQYGYWYHITKGGLAGYWVREVPRRSYLLGRYQGLTYAVARAATLAAGTTYHGYKFDDRGRVLFSASRTYPTDTVAHFDQSATVNGTPYLRMSDGDLGGYVVARATIKSVDF